MCIVLCSIGKSEKYPFILISNRDEYFVRPTASLALLPDTSIIAPKDLARPNGGTWIGCNERLGKVCCLVNYREAVFENYPISRGKLASVYLGEEDGTFEEFVSKHKQEIGGFTFLYGDLSKLLEINVVSNRSSSALFPRGSVFGLSNSRVDEPWPKVVRGKQLLEALMERQIQDKDTLIGELFEILNFSSVDSSNITMEDLPKTIFVPPVKTKKVDKTFIGEYYGTRTQTIILMDDQGEVTYLEKVLYDEDNLVRKDKITRFEFCVKTV